MCFLYPHTWVWFGWPSLSLDVTLNRGEPNFRHSSVREFITFLAESRKLHGSLLFLVITPFIILMHAVVPEPLPPLLETKYNTAHVRGWWKQMYYIYYMRNYSMTRDGEWVWVLCTLFMVWNPFCIGLGCTPKTRIRILFKTHSSFSSHHINSFMNIESS